MSRLSEGECHNGQFDCTTEIVIEDNDYVKWRECHNYTNRKYVLTPTDKTDKGRPSSGAYPAT